MTNRARAAAAGWAAGFALIALAAGCSDGQKTAEVSGVVKVGGRPADKGSVTFIPADGKGQPTGTEIGPDGRYSVRVQYGVMKVEVRVPKVVGKKPLYGKDGPFQDVMEEVLPDKYNNATELTVDVKGTMTKDWDLSPAK